MFTFFFRLAQAEKWTKTKGFQLSCKFNIFASITKYIELYVKQDKNYRSGRTRPDVDCQMCLDNAGLTRDTSLTSESYHDWKYFLHTRLTILTPRLVRIQDEHRLQLFVCYIFITHELVSHQLAFFLHPTRLKSDYLV